jgi:hypothetical protein
MRVIQPLGVLALMTAVVSCGTGTERPLPGEGDYTFGLNGECDDASYDLAIQPIFDTGCLQCHWTNAALGGLDLQSYGGVMDGGVTGAAVGPGDCAGSLLYQRVAGQSASPMPPVGYPDLADAEVDCICLWIAEGTPDS